MSVRVPRIVIYGTGQFGGYITRFALQKGWTIVAAYNRAGPKVGQDLGVLAGVDPIGVIVQDCDSARFDTVEADLGIVTLSDRLARNWPAYARLLGAGLNVLCHGAESYYPWGSNAVVAQQIDALAKQNGVTFTGGGIWDMSRIWAGILAGGPCTEMESLHHHSLTDAGCVGKALATITGIGMSLAEYEKQVIGSASLLSGFYGTIPQIVMDALGYTLTKASERLEPIILDEPIESAVLGRVIPAGYCVGTRIVAEVETAEGVPARAEMEMRQFRPGEYEYMEWAINGLPGTRVQARRNNTAHATAACLFNRIPDVIAAQPGIVLVSQMAPLRHTARLRAQAR